MGDWRLSTLPYPSSLPGMEGWRKEIIRQSRDVCLWRIKRGKRARDAPSTHTTCLLGEGARSAFSPWASCGSSWGQSVSCQCCRALPIWTVMLLLVALGCGQNVILISVYSWRLIPSVQREILQPWVLVSSNNASFHKDWGINSGFTH